MTPDEIKRFRESPGAASPLWLREIAFQLAIFNSHLSGTLSGGDSVFQFHFHGVGEAVLKDIERKLDLIIDKENELMAITAEQRVEINAAVAKVKSDIEAAITKEKAEVIQAIKDAAKDGPLSAADVAEIVGLVGGIGSTAVASVDTIQSAPTPPQP